MTRELRKQGLLHFLMSILAMGIGAVNNLFIFTHDLALKGFIEYLLPLAYLIAIPGIGASFIPLKFFPLTETGKIGYQQLVIRTFVLSASMIAFVAGLIALLYGCAHIMGIELPKPKLEGYYFEFACVMIGTVLIQIFEKLLYINHKVAITALTKNLINKLMIGFAFSLYVFGWLTREGVIQTLPLIYILLVGVLAIYFYQNNKSTLSQQQSVSNPTFNKESATYVKYGLFMVLTVSVSDKITYAMLGSIGTFEENGIFAINNYLASLILIPYLSVISLYSPQISRSLNASDFGGLQNIYSKSSDMLTAMGSGIFLLIWANLSLLPLISQKMSAVLEYKFVGAILAAGYIINLSFSVNDQIISYSEKYKFNIISSITLIVCAVAFNWILIPVFGIYGAALANSIAVLSFNLVKAYFIRSRFSLRAHTRNTLIIFLSALAAFGLMELIKTNSIPGGLLVNNLLVGAVFIFPVLWFKTSIQINSFLKDMISKYLIKNSVS
ncbi:MAG: polysaccharide biosynthesis C-terminal domain-containing protein [Saprospiraceae bacterium]|nr:polysaccharide biosynthesis C-terminal domain-containing protein [Saprospiraceae bacterium]